MSTTHLIHVSLFLYIYIFIYIYIYMPITMLCALFYMRIHITTLLQPIDYTLHAWYMQFYMGIWYTHYSYCVFCNKHISTTSVVFPPYNCSAIYTATWNASVYNIRVISFFSCQHLRHGAWNPFRKLLREKCCQFIYLLFNFMPFSVLMNP